MKVSLTGLLCIVLLAGMTILSSCSISVQAASDNTDKAVTAAVQTTASEAKTDTPDKLTITKKDKEAVVKADKLTYSAKGYQSVSDDSIKFRGKLTMTLTEYKKTSASGRFNRITIAYTSDKPLLGEAVYTVDGKQINDIFYLEAGENADFSLLIDGYLSGKYSDKLTSLTLTPRGDGSADAVVSALTAEEYTVYKDKIYYLKGSRYTVGIKLAWGGGICSITDSKNSVKGLTNLVNQCDTGRLIQQSYYGTYSNDEYQTGTYNGSTWAYNPVQGGNQYGKASRLIDVVISENSVYIKTQPQDWSKSDYLTPSYMEDTYTVYDDRIQVDNRFVDFSGWHHDYKTQEIPAFYTVSYLDTFVRYQGAKSWTGDKLSYERGLNFWGDAKYHNDCCFDIDGGQTETWCAWVNEKDGYGIGLYVPNADSLLAGRFSYNGSKDSLNGATNYVAPVNMFEIVSYHPIEYSYLIATGSVDEIRETFSDNKDFASNASLRDTYLPYRAYKANYTTLDFSTEAAISAFGAPINNTKIVYDADEKAALITAVSGADPYIAIKYSGSSPVLSADKLKKVTITYMIPKSNGYGEYGCELFLCAGDVTGPTGGKSTVINGLKADREYHTVTADLSDIAFWKGDIHMIRFDYFNGANDGDVIYIKSIKLS